MKKIIISLLLSSNIIFSQDFLMQGWYWDYPKTTSQETVWADTLKLKAQELADAGFTYVWLPPLSRASFGSGSNGYDPQDLYDLGEYGGGATGFGTRNNVDLLITEFDNVGIGAVADVVYNHRDGGKAEDNPAVEDYITTYWDWKVDNGYNPFPYDRFRCLLPLGGTSGNSAGDYYFKLSSVSGHSNFNNYEYNIYMQTNTVGWQNLSDDVESEPNGGGDCGEANNEIQLGVDMNAWIDNPTSCRTDEFQLSLAAEDYNASGDTLYIYFGNRNSGYSDMRIYGIWSGPRSDDIADELIYQTYTDFTDMPSEQGAMDWTNFKPNYTDPTNKLDGFWDGLWFFYDYDQNVTSTQNVLYDWTKWLIQDVGIYGLRMDAVKHFPPQFVGELFDYLSANSADVPFTVGEFYDSDLDELEGWIQSVYDNMSTSTITPRLFDFNLRDALKKASDAFGYDARNIFTSGMVDGKGISAFNVVTFMNNHDTRDSSHVVLNDPILGYAYILTNNKIGLPTVFYPDYYNMPDYKPFPSYDLPGMKDELDVLMAVHKKHIYEATSVEYLSGFSTSYSQTFNSGYDNTTLFYQISGTSSGRDLLVAINYAGEELNVDHGLNGSNVDQGSVFIDLIGNSQNPFTTVDGSSNINITLLARSYTVWIEGVTVQAKIFLEGAYNPALNEMNTDLNSSLPLTSPYSEDLRRVEQIDENITDWILVQLYDELTNEPVVSKSVFVNKDGLLCLEDGTTTIPLDAGDGMYYLVIKHRNHLAVASANKISVSASTPFYNFTAP